MKRLLLLTLLLVPVSGISQTQAVPIPFMKEQYSDASGNPYALGTIDFYLSNTSTRKDTCSTYQLATATTCTSANTNPVVLDSAGRAAIWLLPFTYRMVLKNASGSTIWDVSGIPGVTGVALSGTATVNRIPKFTSTAGAISNSSITDDATTVSTAEPITSTGYIAAQTITGTADHSQTSISCIAADSYCRLTSGHTASGTDRPLAIVMGTTPRIQIETSGSFAPLAAATQDNGSATFPWDNGFFDNMVVGVPANRTDFSYIGANSEGGLLTDIAGGNPRLLFRRSQGTQAARTDIVNGNASMVILSKAYSGGTAFDNIEIDGFAEAGGGWSSGQAPGGALKIYTRIPNGALTLGMTIDSSQRVGIGGAPVSLYNLAVTGSGTPAKFISSTTTADLTVANSGTATALVRAAVASTVNYAALVNNAGVTLSVDANANFGLNLMTYGSGVGVIAIHKATTNPSGAIANGGVLYIDSATEILTYLDSAGVAHVLY